MRLNQIINTTLIVASIGVLILIFGISSLGLGTFLIFTVIFLCAYRFFIRLWVITFQLRTFAILEN